MLTLPDSEEQFFHRVGRVGRAECITPVLIEEEAAQTDGSPKRYSAEGIADPFGALAATADDSQRQRGKQAALPVYGEHKAEQSSSATRKHLQEIAASVSSLLSLEKEAQMNFLLLASGKQK
ncbi:hypothetical protein, conserved [Eimeria acervulina]|uniref:Uncharacterized protein n=1 Tax=Eimeria acervulina TaxID=5801 RepID=U6GCQ3_EIMAC|nr:hypothetical protein, conserved [Eimeria acervulina]CDI77098.1 hypothetical protein, conserved [Eimeria acervulina]